MQDVIPKLDRVPEYYEKIHAIVDELMAMAPQLDADRREILQAICIHAGAMHMFNVIGLYLAVMFHGYSGVEYRNGDYLASDLEYWFHYYKELWRKTCRQSTLHNLQNVISSYADLLRGREYVR